MWNPDTGSDTECPAMEPMCQITLAIEVCWFHIGALTNMEPGQWVGHQVSGHGTAVSWNPGSRSGLVQHWCPKKCGTRTLGQTTNVQPWKRCVKSCFIINCQLLTQFTSRPWLQKWACSTSVLSSLWNLDTGADTKLSGHGTNVSNHVF